MINLPNFTSRGRQNGLSLVELMVAVTISLLVLTALSAIFISSTRSRNEMQKSTQQQESGRYASQLLADNLKLGGYLAEFDSSPLTTPATLPDPCEKEVAKLLTALPLHVQGVNNAAAIPSCLSDADVKVGTDIVVVRRVSTCVAGAVGCAAFVEGEPHFQASLCTPTDSSGSELAHAINSDADYAAYHFALSTAAADFTRHKTSCVATDFAAIQRYLVHIYFIANNNEDGDGIPTLKRAELGTVNFNIVPLVDGIENMQIEYGVDSDNDGVPNSYTSAPANTTDWRNTMSARVHLLARNTTSTTGYTDSRTYTLGDTEVAAPGDGYKRHVYSTTAQFVNPSWRRQ
jgi:type IV pilus assembly protein PilW